MPTRSDQAGYALQGLVRFFRKLEAQQARSSQALGWLSDHPTTPDRIEDVEARIRQEGLHATGQGPPGLDEVQAALRRLPPPPPAQAAPAG